ncbi:CAAX protease self-immunity-domain-containing protein, partial [Tribonema minus]
VLVSQWLLVPIALAIAKALSLDILSTVSITGMDIGYGVLGALPVAGVMALLEITQWGWVQRISERTRTFLITLLGKDGGGIFGLFFALGVGIAAGVGEELMFRGLLQGGLQRYLSTEAAVAASAVVFGLLHAVTPMYAVCAGITGAYFSLLWLWSGNLVVPIVAHAVYDIGAMLLLSLQLRGESSAQGTSAAPPVATETTTLK